MGAIDHGRAVRYGLEFIHENRPGLGQAIDHDPVMHHFVPNINRRAEEGQRTVDNLDRAIDSGAKTTGVGQQNVHAAWVAFFR
jgi:hypothetical protein